MVTYVLIGLNVLVFTLMTLFGIGPLEPYTEGIFNWGGIRADAIIGGQWWRLFSYMFVHIGIVHLLANMYALFMIGRGLERLIGKWLFSLSYIVTGIFAGLCSFLGHKDTLIVSAGASGAIAGIFGLFFVLLLTPMIEKRARQNMLKQMGVILAINVGYGLTNGSGVDHYAHIGGLIGGALLGAIYALYGHFAFRMPHLQKKLLKVVSALPVLFLLIAIPVIILKNRDLSPVKFVELTQTLGDYEQTFEEKWVQIDFEGDPEKVAPLLKELVYPEIERTKALSAQLNKLNLKKKPAMIRDCLNQYIALRNKRFLVVIKMYEEEDERYIAEYDEIDHHIQQILKTIQSA